MARLRMRHAGGIESATRIILRYGPIIECPDRPLGTGCRQMSQTNLRDDFLKVLQHIDDVLTKVTTSASGQGALAPADLYTVAEGLFLYAWTHWEQFTHNLLVEDLATISTGRLHMDVVQFTSADAPRRLANQLLSHPDHPQRFIEWSDYSFVESRANEFLGQGNRFAAQPLPRRSDLDLLKRVRNAVAHRSDKAWMSFERLCQDPTSAIPANAISGITPGRFLVDFQRNGRPIIQDAIMMLEAAARHLVP